MVIMHFKLNCLIDGSSILMLVLVEVKTILPTLNDVRLLNLLQHIIVYVYFMFTM